MSRLEILTTSNEDAWMRALDRATQYDFYHLPSYHALAEEQGEGEARLFLYFEGEYSIALPLLLRPVEGPWLPDSPIRWRDATSVYGYAGPVCSHADMPERVGLRFRNALEDKLRELNVLTVFSRLNMFIPQHGLLAGLGECPPLWPTVSIDLTLPSEDQRAQFRASDRTKINRLRRRGITCVHDRDGALLDDFIEIYEETMRRVHAADMYLFPRAYFERLVKALGSRLHIFVCQEEGRSICAGLLVGCQGILQYHLGGTRNDSLELSPMRLLLDDARQWATDSGFHVFHLGGRATSRPNDTVYHFKTGFSDRTHEFSVWRWILFPEVYEGMCRQKARWDERRGRANANSGYFPLYRSPSVACEPLALTAAEPEGIA